MRATTFYIRLDFQIVYLEGRESETIFFLKIANKNYLKVNNDNNFAKKKYSLKL